MTETEGSDEKTGTVAFQLEEVTKSMQLAEMCRLQEYRENSLRELLILSQQSPQKHDSEILKA